MLLLTEPTLFYWNLLNDFTSDLKQAYIGTISNWAQKVQKMNTKNTAHVTVPRGNLSSSRTHQSTNTALSRFTKVATATTVTDPPVTPTNSVVDDSEICLFDEDDQPERVAAHALVGMRKQPSLHNGSSLRNVVAQVEYYYFSPSNTY
jgi:hypothetical protein